MACQEKALAIHRVQSMEDVDYVRIVKIVAGRHMSCRRGKMDTMAWNQPATGSLSTHFEQVSFFDIDGS